MIIINDETLDNYVFCPYTLKHSGNKNKRRLVDVIKNTMSAILIYYSALKKYPSKIWIGKRYRKEWMEIVGTFEGKGQSIKEYNTHYIMLSSVLEWFQRNSIVPISNDLKFLIKINEIEYSANIPHIIYEPMTGKTIPVLYTGITRRTIHLYRMIVHRAALVAAHLAINEINDGYIFSFKDGVFRPADIGPIDDNFIKKTNRDLYAILRNIKDGIMYPNYHSCIRCAFNLECTL